MYEGVVRKWEGWKYHNPNGRNVWIYRYVCGDERFAVSRAAYHALAAGLYHRVYYTPQSKRLVNIEMAPLAEDSARLGSEPAARAAGHWP